jgi:3-hydroxyanthranilate 3,4-dioxygenase
MLPPINFQAWIDENRHLLKPPVGNKCVYTDAGDFIVMVVGGPNQRKDFHYNESEELFYQFEGDITVAIMEDGVQRDIPVREGEMFLLPAKVPHSPRRPAGTIGLVIEKKRDEDDTDGLMWFCENCGAKLYDEYFHLENIVEQLPPIIRSYSASDEKRTCKECGAVMEPPVKA